MTKQRINIDVDRKLWKSAGIHALENGISKRELVGKALEQIIDKEVERMNEIKRVIELVENGDIELEGEGYEIDGYINHTVSGYEIAVYFEEKQHDGEPNGLDDMYDYDKVVAYDSGYGVKWL